jgi:UDP-glucuronate 4-epimerase
MTILVTGAAGFIGHFVCKKLLDNGYKVVGIDNINDYYSPELKYSRLSKLGILKVEVENAGLPCFSVTNPNFIFYKVDLIDKKNIDDLFNKYSFDKVCHLAAQAGVRYSIENPSVYIQSNLIGFFNILEAVRHAGIDHLIYASSSSVYGESKDVPFCTNQCVDRPISLYAATKKSNELMAYTYSHLFDFATTGLRFFTVYGPLGRPDMAYFRFAEAIINDEPIKVYNSGALSRDFTYIDDIVEGILKIISEPIKERDKYKIYNIGNSHPEKLVDFIEIIENHLGKKAKRELLPMQPGDVSQTYADISDLITDYGYAPKTTINEGLYKFIQWYKEYKQNQDM